MLYRVLQHANLVQYYEAFVSQGTSFSLILLLQHSFNGLLSRTTWVSQYQKCKTSLDLDEARGVGVLGWHWHQLDHMQTICTLLLTDNHTNTSSLFFTGWMLVLTPNQQCQSTEGQTFPSYIENIYYTMLTSLTCNALTLSGGRGLRLLWLRTGNRHRAIRGRQCRQWVTTRHSHARRFSDFSRL